MTKMNNLKNYSLKICQTKVSKLGRTKQNTAK